MYMNYQVFYICELLILRSSALKNVFKLLAPRRPRSLFSLPICQVDRKIHRTHYPHLHMCLITYNSVPIHNPGYTKSLTTHSLLPPDAFPVKTGEVPQRFHVFTREGLGRVEHRQVYYVVVGDVEEVKGEAKGEGLGIQEVPDGASDVDLGIGQEKVVSLGSQGG